MSQTFVASRAFSLPLRWHSPENRVIGIFAPQQPRPAQAEA
ncbi:hypothetical protein [Methylobacterium aquaticum]|nr:hypothetical protein [Methylobacterium aquaticum]